MKTKRHFLTCRYNPSVKKSRSKIINELAIFCFSILLLSGCSTGLSEDEIIESALALEATSLAATNHARPSNTATQLPSETPTLTPSPNATATFTETPSQTPAPTLGSSNIYLNIYVIAANIDGPIGCGEELVALSTGKLPSGHAESDVRAVLETLFSLRVQYQYNTYNPLYSSSLIITSVQFEDEFNEIVVRTTGNLNRGEKGCDWDRIRLMVRATTRAAANGKSVEVRFNQHAFNDYVSSDR